MPEPVRKEQQIWGGRNRPDADAGKPKLDVIPGGSTTPRSERVEMDVLSDEAETAPTEPALNTARAREQVPAAALEASASIADEDAPTGETEATKARKATEMTPPPEPISFNLTQATADASNPSMVSRIGAWLSGKARGVQQFLETTRTKQHNAAVEELVKNVESGAVSEPAEVAPTASHEAAVKELMDKAEDLVAADRAAEAEATAAEVIWNQTLGELGIMPRDENAERRQPWDEKPSDVPVWDEKAPDIMSPETRKAVEAAKPLLKRGWESLRNRINDLFEDNEGNLDDRKVFGASAAFGVIGAFAMTALLAHQMEGFQKNVKDYLEFQQDRVAQMEASGVKVDSIFSTRSAE